MLAKKPTTETGMVALLELDEQEAAERLLDGALKRNELTKAALRDALESGYGKVLEHGHPTTWTPPTSPRDRAVVAAGRLILRVAREIGLPLEAQQGASAMNVLRELLAH